METVSHVEKLLVQREAKVGITWGNRWGRWEADNQRLTPSQSSFSILWVISGRIFPHVWGAASVYTRWYSSCFLRVIPE